MKQQDGIVDLIERLARLVTGEGHAHGLKPAQWEALRYLARANRFSRTPGALTAYLGSTKGTVSQTLMSLERAGLVEKTSNPADRRSVTIDLSPQGAALLENDTLDKIRRALALLPPQTVHDLDSGLRSLLEARLSVTGGRPFGVCGECRHFSAGQNGEGRFCRLLRVPLSSDDACRICYEHEPA